MRKYLELFKDDFDSSIETKMQPENKPYVAYSIKSGSVVYTVVKADDSETYLAYKVISGNGVPSGIEYNLVDMGTYKQARDENGNPMEDANYNPIWTDEPLLWSDRNIGASSINDGGLSFAWGETQKWFKQSSEVQELTPEQLVEMLNDAVGILLEVELGIKLTVDNLQEVLELFEIPSGEILGCYSEIPSDWNNYKYTIGEYEVNIENLDNIVCGTCRVTKYGTKSEQWGGEGEVDNKTVLDLEDDAAYVNMGPDWRMPTEAECLSMIKNSVKEYDENTDCYKFTSNITGNTLLFPTGLQLSCSSGSQNWVIHTSSLYYNDDYQSLGVNMSNSDESTKLVPQRWCSLPIRGVKS